MEPEEDQLTELVLRKYARYLEDDEDGKGREKVIRALMRLGHGYYDAAGAVDEAAARLDEKRTITPANEREDICLMPTKIGMVSLGCPKNQVDAELLMHTLHQGGL